MYTKFNIDDEITISGVVKHIRIDWVVDDPPEISYGVIIRTMDGDKLLWFRDEYIQRK